MTNPPPQKSDLYPVSSAAHEDGQMAREPIQAPLVAHDREEAVVTSAQVLAS